MKSKNSECKLKQKPTCFWVKTLVQPLITATYSLNAPALLQASTEDRVLQPGSFFYCKFDSEHHKTHKICSAPPGTVRSSTGCNKDCMVCFYSRKNFTKSACTQRSKLESFQCVRVHVAKACSPFFGRESTNAAIMLIMAHFAAVVIWFVHSRSNRHWGGQRMGCNTWGWVLWRAGQDWADVISIKPQVAYQSGGFSLSEKPRQSNSVSASTAKNRAAEPGGAKGYNYLGIKFPSTFRSCLFSSPVCFLLKLAKTDMFPKKEVIVWGLCLCGNGPDCSNLPGFVSHLCLGLGVVSFLSDLFSCPHRLPLHRATWLPLGLSILPTFKHLKCGSVPTVSTQQIFPSLLRRQVQENKSRSMDLHPPIGLIASPIWATRQIKYLHQLSDS